MKTYRGFRTEPGGDTATPARVIVERPSHDDDEPLAMSGVARRKSPTGFNWGYEGSGPAALAHSLLLDATGSDEVADTMFQLFKREVVARWAQTKDWLCTQEFIIQWVRDQKVA